ncbi:MAG: VOC family protein [Mycobacterium kyogaense]|uniref:VOC family protein n=1 Tax=Mycobacterium kyogaense TaxID=2212479 RepID=UPI002FF550D9
MAIDFHELTLFVSDVDATARFYEAIGLALFCIEEPEYSRHYDGELGLQLWPATARRPVSSVPLGFVVEDISATVRRRDAVGASWTCDLPNFVRTSDPEGDKITLTQR